MLRFSVIVVVLCANSALGDSTLEASMPIQEFFWNDENLNKIFRENNEIESSIEVLKVRLELQQSLYEQQIMRMENLLNKIINGTISQTCLEAQKTFNNDLLNVLKSIDSKWEAKLKNESQVERLSSCAEALKKTHQNGIYNITLHNYREPFPVYCENNIFGGKWTVIQRRQDGSVDFFRNWTEYKNGFGDLNGEFFIGLDKLHALTAESPQELLIELEDFDNDIRYAKYDSFAVGSGHEDYPLSVLGSYSGNVKDSLSYHQGMKFSTKDRDNDETTADCANLYKGAWWYKTCQESSLNGLYLRGYGSDYGLGVLWYKWRGEKYSLKRVQMLIRSKV